MKEGYNSKSCNALEKPFYRPAEAALRWCGLIAHEAQILRSIGEDGIPKTAQFPQWGCLQPNTEKILDAILNGDIPYGRDGVTTTAGDHVAKARLTVRHTDLREWMAKHYPDQKPAFLFDEIERKTHAAISADSFRSLQADLEAARAEIEMARKWGEKIKSDYEALQGECMSLRAMVDKGLTTTERNTLLTIIAALCDYSAIKPDDRGAAKRIETMTAEIGATVTDDTVRRWLKLIPDALAPRMK
jgi:hypothetical protein